MEDVRYNSLDVHYPSVLTTYYATGQWIEENQDKSRFYIADEGKDTQTLIFDGVVSKTRDIEGTFFRADPSRGPDPLLSPSSIHNYYWLQAPIPPCVHEKFLSITNNSGKFLVFVRPIILDTVWTEFKEAYKEGKLGYGLQCSTSKPNSNATSDDCLITIHTGDAFDLDEVAKIAWHIDKVRGNWSGVIHYMTDRTTKKLYGSNSVGEKKSLYSISSRSFIIDSINGGMDKKTIEHFINTFKLKFTEKAQDRQNLLKDINSKKFLYK